MFRDEYNISSVSSARNQTPNPNAKLPILPKASTAHFYLYHSITDKNVITVAKARKIIEKSQSKLHSHFAEKKNEIESKQTASIKEQEETRRKSYKPVPSHDPVYQRAVRLRAEQRSAELEAKASLLKFTQSAKSCVDTHAEELRRREQRYREQEAAAKRLLEKNTDAAVFTQGYIKAKEIATYLKQKETEAKIALQQFHHYDYSHKIIHVNAKIDSNKQNEALYGRNLEIFSPIAVKTDNANVVGGNYLWENERRSYTLRSPRSSEERSRFSFDSGSMNEKEANEGVNGSIRTRLQKKSDVRSLYEMQITKTKRKEMSSRNSAEEGNLENEKYSDGHDGNWGEKSQVALEKEPEAISTGGDGEEMPETEEQGQQSKEKEGHACMDSSQVSSEKVESEQRTQVVAEDCQGFNGSESCVDAVHIVSDSMMKTEECVSSFKTWITSMESTASEKRSEDEVSDFDEEKETVTNSEGTIDVTLNKDAHKTSLGDCVEVNEDVVGSNEKKCLLKDKADAIQSNAAEEISTAESADLDDNAAKTVDENSNETKVDSNVDRKDIGMEQICSNSLHKTYSQTYSFEQVTTITRVDTVSSFSKEESTTKCAANENEQCSELKKSIFNSTFASETILEAANITCKKAVNMTADDTTQESRSEGTAAVSDSADNEEASVTEVKEEKSVAQSYEICSTSSPHPPVEVISEQFDKASESNIESVQIAQNLTEEHILGDCALAGEEVMSSSIFETVMLDVVDNEKSYKSVSGEKTECAVDETIDTNNESCNKIKEGKRIVSEIVEGNAINSIESARGNIVFVAETQIDALESSSDPNLIEATERNLDASVVKVEDRFVLMHEKVTTIDHVGIDSSVSNEVGHQPKNDGENLLIRDAEAESLATDGIAIATSWYMEHILKETITFMEFKYGSATSKQKSILVSQSDESADVADEKEAMHVRTTSKSEIKMEATNDVETEAQTLEADKDFQIDDISEGINDDDTEMVLNSGDRLDAKADVTCVDIEVITNVNESTEESTIMTKHSRVICQEFDTMRTDGTQVIIVSNESVDDVSHETQWEHSEKAASNVEVYDSDLKDVMKLTDDVSGYTDNVTIVDRQNSLEVSDNEKEEIVRTDESDEEVIESVHFDASVVEEAEVKTYQAHETEQDAEMKKDTFVGISWHMNQIIRVTLEHMDMSIMLANVSSNVGVSEQVEHTFESVSSLPQESSENLRFPISSQLEGTVGDEALSDVEENEANDMDDVESDDTRIVSSNAETVLESVRLKSEDQEDVRRVYGNISRIEVELNEDYGAEIVDTEDMSTISDVQTEGKETLERHSEGHELVDLRVIDEAISSAETLNSSPVETDGDITRKKDERIGSSVETFTTERKFIGVSWHMERIVRTTVDYLESERSVKHITRPEEVRNEVNDIRKKDVLDNLDDVKTSDSKAEVESHSENIVNALESQKALGRTISKERVLLDSNVISTENEHRLVETIPTHGFSEMEAITQYDATEADSDLNIEQVGSDVTAESDDAVTSNRSDDSTPEAQEENVCEAVVSEARIDRTDEMKGSLIENFDAEKHAEMDANEIADNSVLVNVTEDVHAVEASCQSLESRMEIAHEVMDTFVGVSWHMRHIMEKALQSINIDNVTEVRTVQTEEMETLNEAQSEKVEHGQWNGSHSSDIQDSGDVEEDTYGEEDVKDVQSEQMIEDIVVQIVSDLHEEHSAIDYVKNQAEVAEIANDNNMEVFDDESYATDSENEEHEQQYECVGDTTDVNIERADAIERIRLDDGSGIITQIEESESVAEEADIEGNVTASNNEAEEVVFLSDESFTRNIFNGAYVQSILKKTIDFMSLEEEKNDEREISLAESSLRLKEMEDFQTEGNESEEGELVTEVHVTDTISLINKVSETVTTQSAHTVATTIVHSETMNITQVHSQNDTEALDADDKDHVHADLEVESEDADAEFMSDNDNVLCPGIEDEKDIIVSMADGNASDKDDGHETAAAIIEDAPSSVLDVMTVGKGLESDNNQDLIITSHRMDAEETEQNGEYDSLSEQKVDKDVTLQLNEMVKVERMEVMTEENEFNQNVSFVEFESITMEETKVTTITTSSWETEEEVYDNESDVLTQKGSSVSMEHNGAQSDAIALSENISRESTTLNGEIAIVKDDDSHSSTTVTAFLDEMIQRIEGEECTKVSDLEESRIDDLTARADTEMETAREVAQKFVQMIWNEAITAISFQSTNGHNRNVSEEETDSKDVEVSRNEETHSLLEDDQNVLTNTTEEAIMEVNANGNETVYRQQNGFENKQVDDSSSDGMSCEEEEMIDETECTEYEQVVTTVRTVSKTTCETIEFEQFEESRGGIESFAKTLAHSSLSDGDITENETLIVNDIVSSETCSDQKYQNTLDMTVTNDEEHIEYRSNISQVETVSQIVEELVDVSVKMSEVDEGAQIDENHSNTLRIESNETSDSEDTNSDTLESDVIEIEDVQSEDRSIALDEQSEASTEAEEAIEKEADTFVIASDIVDNLITIVQDQPRVNSIDTDADGESASAIADVDSHECDAFASNDFPIKSPSNDRGLTKKTSEASTYSEDVEMKTSLEIDSHTEIATGKCITVSTLSKELVDLMIDNISESDSHSNVLNEKETVSVERSMSRDFASDTSDQIESPAEESMDSDVQKVVSRRIFTEESVSTITTETSIRSISSVSKADSNDSVTHTNVYSTLEEITTFSSEHSNQSIKVIETFASDAKAIESTEENDIASEKELKVTEESHCDDEEGGIDSTLDEFKPAKSSLDDDSNEKRVSSQSRGSFGSFLKTFNLRGSGIRRQSEQSHKERRESIKVKNDTEDSVLIASEVDSEEFHDTNDESEAFEKEKLEYQELPHARDSIERGSFSSFEGSRSSIPGLSSPIPQNLSTYHDLDTTTASVANFLLGAQSESVEERPLVQDDLSTSASDAFEDAKSNRTATESSETRVSIDESRNSKAVSDEEQMEANADTKSASKSRFGAFKSSSFAKKLGWKSSSGN
ncbi:unnamed protein product [Albugo candida]|uniref:AlNc14C74G5013 protein n=1 Tax=Albugo candida TaxID=65357 RepID=A0A024G6L9_9STRA|nr:unnamed protein product [Albugo candida]|eukprot:CCI42219.1 unnamed protein product [Albugo candida]